MQPLGDFHVHTNFCPHGTSDSMEDYVRAAINYGLKAISFTEHAPLPLSFHDPVPKQDSAMRWEDVHLYLQEGNRLKQMYKEILQINIGFEVDYIEGFEEETINFLNQYGPFIDDAILSVHMLKAPDHRYVCLDYSVDNFAAMINQFGTTDLIYQTYFRTVTASIKADLGNFKPKRIGHINLVEKFSKKYPPSHTFLDEIKPLLMLIQQKGYALDTNTAGLFKDYCQKLYPDTHTLKEAAALGIPLVPGSDSHSASTVARGFDQFPVQGALSNPIPLP